MQIELSVPGFIAALYQYAAESGFTGPVVRAATDYGQFILLEVQSVIVRLAKSLALSALAEACVFLIFIILARLVWTYMSQLIVASSGPGIAFFKQLALTILTIVNAVIILALATAFHIQCASLVRDRVRNALASVTGLPEIHATLPPLIDPEASSTTGWAELPPDQAGDEDY